MAGLEALVDAAFALLLPVVVVVTLVGVVVSLFVRHQRRKQKERDLARLLARDPSLVRTIEPCGWAAAALAEGFDATPRGDRRHGLAYGVSGQVSTHVLGRPVPVECAAFQWWWEVRRRRTSSRHGNRTTYERRNHVVAALRLPVIVPVPVTLRPESVLGRIGLTRGGHQLESSEFNRHFRIEAADRTLALKLLDAGMQRLLTESFTGRTIELRGDLLLLAGAPSHDDPTLIGVVGQLPAVRQDVVRLVEAVPAAYWRRVGVTA